MSAPDPAELTMVITPYGTVIGTLSIWTIYDNPRDFPGKFVLRRWEVGAETEMRMQPVPEPIVTDTLEEARAALPRGLRNVGRQPHDDSVIVESWL